MNSNNEDNVVSFTRQVNCQIFIPDIYDMVRKTGAKNRHQKMQSRLLASFSWACGMGNTWMNEWMNTYIYIVPIIWQWVPDWKSADTYSFKNQRYSSKKQFLFL